MNKIVKFMNIKVVKNKCNVNNQLYILILSYFLIRQLIRILSKFTTAYITQNQQLEY